MIPVVVLRTLGARLQPHLETGEDDENVPAQLQHGVPLARTQGAEREQRVLQLSSRLVELCVYEAIVLEHLQQQ